MSVEAPPAGRVDDRDVAGAAARAPRRSAAIVAVLAAMAMVVLDAGVSNLALPTIAHSLSIAPATAVLVVTAYQAAVLMALLPCGALGERFGHARVFGAGVAMFTLASALSALSPSLPWLLAARFVQGLGGGAILALGVALLRLSVSDQRLGAAIGWNAMTVALATALSPVIGAVLLSELDWRWIYALNILPGALVLLALRGVAPTRGQGEPLDLPSMALNGAVFGLLVVSVHMAPSQPWLAALIFGAGAGALLLLVRREWTKTAPLIPFDLLRGASFRFAVLASICCFIGQTLGLIALPFYLQHGLGLSVGAVGLLMTPWPLAVAVTAVATGRLVNRIPTWMLCTAGGVVLTFGLAGAALWPLHGDPQALIGFTMLCGVGFGFFQIPNNRTLFLAAPSARSGAAGGMQGTARLLGQTSGALIMSFVFARIALDAAPQIGLAFGAGFTALAALISALRRKL